MDGHHSSNAAGASVASPMLPYVTSVSYSRSVRVLRDPRFPEPIRPPVDTSDFAIWNFVNFEIPPSPTITNSPHRIEENTFKAHDNAYPSNILISHDRGFQGSSVGDSINYGRGSPAKIHPPPIALASNIGAPNKMPNSNLKEILDFDKFVAAVLTVSRDKSLTAPTTHPHNEERHQVRPVVRDNVPRHGPPNNPAQHVSYVRCPQILSRPPIPALPPPKLAPLPIMNDQQRSPAAARVNVHRLVDYVPTFALPKASQFHGSVSFGSHVYSPNLSGTTSPSIASPSHPVGYIGSIQPVRLPPTSSTPISNTPRTSVVAHKNLKPQNEIKKNSPSTEKEYPCDFPGCSKIFQRRYNRRVHYRRHTNDEPYPCKVSSCEHRFKWRSSLAHHMRSRHPGFISDSQTKKSPSPRNGNNSNDRSNRAEPTGNG